MPKKNSAPKPNPAPKAFDVFKPGKALAPPTSRPVITGRKPAVRDAMFTDKPGKLVPNARSDRKLLDPADNVTVPTSADEAAPESPVPQPPVSIDLPVQSNVEESAQDQVADEPESPTETSSSPVPESTEEPAEKGSGFNDSTSTAPSDEQVPPEVTVDKGDSGQVPTPAPAVDMSRVVVSHHKPVGGSKWKGVTVILVIVLLVAATIDAALDAGIWTPNYNIPHTHFLSR